MKRLIFSCFLVVFCVNVTVGAAIKDRKGILQRCMDEMGIENKALKDLDNKDLIILVTKLEAFHEKELLLLPPYLAIRRWIEVHEALLAPEFDDPKAVFKNMDVQLDFHEAKWLKILEKKDDPIVQKLIKLIDAAKIPRTIFCRRIGGFFMISSGRIHAPPLKAYTPTEMETILREELGIKDDNTINSVTKVLMKM